MLWPLTALLILFISDVILAKEYYGTKIGPLSTLYHEVSGDVYAVDSKTLHIRNFKYDGDGPDAYFWAGTTPEPSKDGFIVPDERGTLDVLQPYRNKQVTLTLPDGKTLKDIKWLSVWCRKFTVDFGNVKIPHDLKTPQSLDMGPIPGVEHGLSSGPIVMVDAQTFMVPDLTLDGLAPDAHWWAGRDKPSANGTLVPDETGSDKPLGLYNKKTVIITLPEDMTVFDIDYFGVWCRLAASDFGHLKMPRNINVPPSPKMLGQSVKQKLNCEVLNFDPPVEVRWAISGHKVIIQLVTRIPIGEYVSFGLSGNDQQSVMVGGNVVVAWIDRKNVGHAVDYYLGAKAQCAGGQGTCPVDKVKHNSSQVTLLNSALVEGFMMITYTRPLSAKTELHKKIVTDYPQPVIWAVGPLNSLNEASYHNVRNLGSQFIVFGRMPKWNCPSYDPNSSPRTPVPPVPPTRQHPSYIPSPSPPTNFPSPAFPPASPPPNNYPPSSFPPASQPNYPDAPFPPASQPNYPNQPFPPANPPNYPNAPFPPANPQFPPSNFPTTFQNTDFTPPFLPLQSSNSTPSEKTEETEEPATTQEPSRPEAISLEPWYIPPILCNEPADGVFYAQMGPTGGKRGYQAITGNVGWGIAWFINGLLIPEITVVRGRNYRFVVEGGNDSETPARNHPFYITDDPEGGFAYKTPDERTKVRVFAGVDQGKDGPRPTGLGRLCQWTPANFQPAEEFNSFGEYQRHLNLKCSDGHPGMVNWTPDANTPDTVYYHCYTHRYLGWKIHVVDECDLEAESSVIHETKVLPPPSFHLKAVNHEAKSLEITKSGINSLPFLNSEVLPGQKRQESPIQSGFNPVSRSNPETPENSTRVVNPFLPNTSVPFHSGFRPGIPTFGGFVSTTNNRRPSVVAVSLPKQIVPQLSFQNPHLPIIPERNLGIGPFIREAPKIRKPHNPNERPQSQFSDLSRMTQSPPASDYSGEVLQAASSEQQSVVVFRTHGGRNVPPLPHHLELSGNHNRNLLVPPKIKVANMQPISFDGSPVPHAHFSEAQPLPTVETKKKPAIDIQQTRQYGPFKGQKPPEVPEVVPPLPQFHSRLPEKPRFQSTLTTPPASETDYNILNNVWNIISSQGGKGK